MVDILKPPSKPGPPRFFEITGRLIEETKEGLDMGNNERSQNPPLAAAGASWAAIQVLRPSIPDYPCNPNNVASFYIRIYASSSSSRGWHISKSLGPNRGTAAGFDLHGKTRI
jgi:hypothetical protein